MNYDPIYEAIYDNVVRPEIENERARIEETKEVNSN
jgi:hypothetical protein